ncbi:protein of unknown function [Thermococcus camini]|uniref:Uncharacterized protein n=1 Tax=Thermococcus camini TaxID=2016373 RepID=A0A7G2D8L4_9EURY|nr:protein of unknown function [Thermococcus camini]
MVVALDAYKVKLVAIRLQEN